MTKKATPASLGYRMPAEWEPHSATWLTWPHDGAHWPEIFDRIPPIWARIVKELIVGEDVHIAIHDETTDAVARRVLNEVGIVIDDTGRGTMHCAPTRSEDTHCVNLHRIPNNFPWMRDHGPIFLKNKEVGAYGHTPLLMTHWIYNAWGDQWAHDLDEKIPEALEKMTGIERVAVPMVLEGGSIDVNGCGTLLTTEHCLLNPNRNPGLTKAQIEEFLKQYLGISLILWLGEGIQGDDTSGHVDDLARFVGPHSVVTIVNDDPSDPDHAPLAENFRRLQSMKDQDGNPLEIITIHQPKPVMVGGKRIPASYANFYIGNECVLVPVWNDPSDDAAIGVLQKCFPTRRIVPIDSRDLTWGFGSFHCVTQQQPLYL